MPPLNLVEEQHASATLRRDAKQADGVEFRIVTERPNFTLEQLRVSIPRHCFHRSALWSILYLLRDFFFIASVYVIMYWCRDTVSAYPYLTLPLFWAVQGFLMWALFVVGHDCGHGSFSDSESLNHFFGHIAHSPLLVPFHSWRLSHAKHHQNTGNADNDETFVPPTATEYATMTSTYKTVRFHLYWLGGWAIYLLRGMPHTFYSHFDSNSPLFAEKDRPLVKTSVKCVFVVAAILAALAFKYGVSFVAMYYFGPYLVFCAWISIVTHSHHTHPDVPWYRGAEWDFLRGALSTVDRNYGPGIEHIHHNIGTHVVHHLFSRIPHYNLLEASAAIKPLLGSHHRVSHTPMVSTMLLMNKFCRCIPDVGNVLFYSNPERNQAKHH